MRFIAIFSPDSPRAGEVIEYRAGQFYCDQGHVGPLQIVEWDRHYLLQWPDFKTREFVWRRDSWAWSQYAVLGGRERTYLIGESQSPQEVLASSPKAQADAQARLLAEERRLAKLREASVRRPALDWSEVLTRVKDAVIFVAVIAFTVFVLWFVPQMAYSYFGSWAVGILTDIVIVVAVVISVIRHVKSNDG